MQATKTVHYDILRIIYEIVKEDRYPLKYLVHPRELILRSMQDWSSIHSSLAVLEGEGLIVTRQLETLQIAITQAGFDFCCK